MSAQNSVPSVPPNARQRSTRDRPAKAPLSEGWIVDAALAILKSEGPEAVTMRKVGQALDTGAASLYVYVSGREGLLEAMLDRVIATVEMEAPDSTRWRTQLHDLLARLHDALVSYPGIASMTLSHPPTTEAVLRLTENLFGMMLAGGVDPQSAAWGCDIFVNLATAAAREDDVRHPRGHADGEHLQSLYATFARQPREMYPFISAHARQLVAGSSGERFHFAIDALIDGMIARTSRLKPTGPRVN